MTKLLLLDKDGTLVAPGSGEKFVQHPQDQVVLPGVREAIAQYRGAIPVIVSNQGGVAAHHKTLENAIAEMRYCMELLAEIETAYFCPDFDGSELYVVGPGEKEVRRQYTQNKGWFRKPGPGMLKWAIEYYSADTALMVGDRPEDEAAAAAAGIEFLAAQEWRMRSS